MGTKPAAVQETAGEEEAEVVVRQTALRAATNVPSRRRTRVRAAASAASFFSPGAWKRSAFHALPEYLKDNEYILHWHRPTLPWRESAKSLFFLHSETGNIWTHLLGACPCGHQMAPSI